MWTCRCCGKPFIDYVAWCLHEDSCFENRRLEEKYMSDMVECPYCRGAKVKYQSSAAGYGYFRCPRCYGLGKIRKDSL